MEEDVNIMYNNTYIRIFYTCFPFGKKNNFKNLKPWLTKGIKISCLNKTKLRGLSPHAAATGRRS